jgi:glucose/arabinose dehydrogenase
VNALRPNALWLAFLPFLAAVIPAAGAQVFPSSAGNLTVETVAGGLVHPWSLAFLSDGRMLVTERPGRMRLVSRGGKLSQPIGGVPKAFVSNQAGLMDVVLDHDYATSNRIYFCYAEPTAGGAHIAVAQARLVEGRRLVDRTEPRLVGVTVIFRQEGPASHGLNIGCRIVQAPDGNLLITLGDHFGPMDMAQSLDNHIGKIVRITPDGTVPSDNPFIGKAGARPEIWAYGLRNPQGLAYNPADGSLWEQEHGPRGGDEINIIEKGRNYGWPRVSYGVHYDGTPVGNGSPKAPGITDPVWHWTPSIAPAGMTFYTGDLFPGWKGSIINGALKFQLVSRLVLEGGKVVREERILQGLNERIRDVRQGPDGALYLLTDNSEGRILRVVPAK